MSTIVATDRLTPPANGEAQPLTLADVCRALEARAIWCPDPSIPVAGVVAADLMSDVLVGSRPGQLLITSLVSPLTVRTAAIMEFAAVVFVRGKDPWPDVVALARNARVPLLSTPKSTFEAAGILYALVFETPGGTAPHARLSDTSMVRSWDLTGGDFARAGLGATAIKDTLTRIGIPPDVVRRLAVAAYEAEMNVAMYAHRGTMTLTLERRGVVLDVRDEGPGIPDVELAMREGYSTATPALREMGFGAGMGLPNIKRVSDHFTIESEVGRGTHLVMRFNLDGQHA